MAQACGLSRFPHECGLIRQDKEIKEDKEDKEEEEEEEAEEEEEEEEGGETGQRRRREFAGRKRKGKTQEKKDDAAGGDWELPSIFRTLRGGDQWQSRCCVSHKKVHLKIFGQNLKHGTAIAVCVFHDFQGPIRSITW